MRRFYIIPGLATDERLFHRLKIENAEITILKWPEFDPEDSMESYAKKFLPQIDPSKPFHLMGVSFGGMCAVEISKLLKPEKLILVSSAKGSDEVPFFIKMFRYFPLHKVLPQEWIIKMSEAVKYFLGRLDDDDRKLLVKMLRDCPDNYLNGAIQCIVGWNSPSRTIQNLDILHIHGTLDRVIPLKNVRKAIPVKNGTHFMILNKAGEVNQVLKQKLNPELL